MLGTATAVTAPGSGQAAVDPDVVRRLLAAMAAGARLASQQFWSRMAV